MQLGVRDEMRPAYCRCGIVPPFAHKEFTVLLFWEVETPDKRQDSQHCKKHEVGHRRLTEENEDGQQ
jgi:hypothetical protein